MRSAARWLAALVLTAGMVSACGGPPPEKRSDAELLALGYTHLDEIGVPSDWKLESQNSAHKKGKLRWTRAYETHTTGEEAARAYDKLAASKGWSRHKTCVNGNGIPCWTYRKHGLTIWPGINESAICDHHLTCTNITVSMTENFDSRSPESLMPAGSRPGRPASCGAAGF